MVLGYIGFLFLSFLSMGGFFLYNRDVHLGLFCMVMQDTVKSTIILGNICN
jgi:hypothetical protein